mmetsp:Transcript_5338/g.15059  ORF Transcript_5338/g.15059 Transcript_5338/m.15059 type:complete len:110 (+) Transcript_5338:2132-2461(+)
MIVWTRGKRIGSISLIGMGMPEFASSKTSAKAANVNWQKLLLVDMTSAAGQPGSINLFVHFPDSGVLVSLEHEDSQTLCTRPLHGAAKPLSLRQIVVTFACIRDDTAPM